MAILPVPAKGKRKTVDCCNSENCTSKKGTEISQFGLGRGLGFGDGLPNRRNCVSTFPLQQKHHYIFYVSLKDKMAILPVPAKWKRKMVDCWNSENCTSKKGTENLLAVDLSEGLLIPISGLIQWLWHFNQDSPTIFARRQTVRHIVAERNILSLRGK